ESSFREPPGSHKMKFPPSPVPQPNSPSWNKNTIKCGIRPFQCPITVSLNPNFENEKDPLCGHDGPFPNGFCQNQGPFDHQFGPEHWTDRSNGRGQHGSQTILGSLEIALRESL